MGTRHDHRDFITRVGRSDRGTFVCVIHLPTGMSQAVDPVGEELPDDVARRLLQVLLEEVPVCVPWPPGLTVEIRRLITESKRSVGDVGRLARTHDALPVSPDLWSYVLLREDGAVLRVEEDEALRTGADEVTARRDGRRTLRILAIAARRFPALTKFLPAVPAEAEACRLCAGSGRLQEAWCPGCGGLGNVFALRLPSS